MKVIYFQYKQQKWLAYECPTDREWTLKPEILSNIENDSKVTNSRVWFSSLNLRPCTDIFSLYLLHDAAEETLFKYFLYICIWHTAVSLIDKLDYEIIPLWIFVRFILLCWNIVKYQYIFRLDEFTFLCIKNLYEPSVL